MLLDSIICNNDNRTVIIELQLLSKSVGKLRRVYFFNFVKDLISGTKIGRLMNQVEGRGKVMGKTFVLKIQI